MLSHIIRFTVCLLGCNGIQSTPEGWVTHRVNINKFCNIAIFAFLFFFFSICQGNKYLKPTLNPMTFVSDIDEEHLKPCWEICLGGQFFLFSPLGFIYFSFRILLRWRFSSGGHICICIAVSQMFSAWNKFIPVKICRASVRRFSSVWAFFRKEFATPSINQRCVRCCIAFEIAYILMLPHEHNAHLLLNKKST